MDKIKQWLGYIVVFFQAAYDFIAVLAKEIYEWFQDSPTFIRWLLLIVGFTFLLSKAGVGVEEMKVALLLIWYSIIATGIASFMNYAYGKVNYHKAKDEPIYIYAQVAIFVGVYIFAGLFILGTYIAQFS